MPYTATRDWLKPKGVSALTDGSGVVYYSTTLSAKHVTCESLPCIDNDHVEQWHKEFPYGGWGVGKQAATRRKSTLQGLACTVHIVQYFV